MASIKGPCITSARSGQAYKSNKTWDNGFYITVGVNGHSVDFLIDTGSTVTIISNETFARINKQRPLELTSTDFEILGVGGCNIPVKGQLDTTLTFVTSKVSRRHRVVVADIHQDAILGNDFLTTVQCDLFLWRRTMKLDGKDIPLWHIPGGADVVCRVEVRHKVHIPPRSVRLIDIRIQNAEHLDSVAVVEPANNLFIRKEIIAARGITNPQNDSQVMRIINCGDSTVDLPAGFTIGTCESVAEPVNTHSAAACDVVKESVTVNISPPETESNNKRHMADEDVQPDDEVANSTDNWEVPDHLVDLWTRSSELLSEDEGQLLADLLITYQDVFAKSSDDFGQTSLVKHTINTGSAAPVRQPPRRQPIERRRVEREEVEKMLAKGVIEPSSSPWASGVVLVPKKDGTTRFCVDYRRLNELTVKDAYPLPRISECLDSLSGATWFSCMDLCSGYWQVEMASEDKEKTAFATRMGLYQFKVMPFGLCNAPSTFERLMDTVMRGLQWDECLVYLDDIIIPGATIPQSIERLTHVLLRLKDAGLKLKPSKCHMFRKEVAFLGHVVSEHGVSTDPSKIEVIRDWPEPVDVKQVRSFLGLCGYYRRFIRGFAAIAAPLHKLTRKGVAFTWTDPCQQAFNDLKTALTTAPILGYPCEEGQYTLDTDASNQAIGAVLSQEQQGQEKVIAYFSKVHSKAEQNYCITRKELLAVVESVKHFRHYIYGRHTILRTDNAAVSWMRNLKDPAGQMARWLQHLETFDLEVHHRPGNKHCNADALSRMPCKQCGNSSDPEKMENDTADQEQMETTDHEQVEWDTTDQEQVEMDTTDESEPPHVRVTTRKQSKKLAAEFRQTDHLLDGWDPVEIRNQQQADKDIQPLMTAVEAGQPRPLWQDISAESQNLKTLWRQWERIQVIGGILYRKWYEADGSYRWQMVTPKEKRKDVLWHFHDAPTGGHLGVERTAEKARHHFYWPRMRYDVQKYCKRCDKCAARKKGQQKRAPLRQYTVGECMERLAVDILGPLPETTRGNKYIMVVADHFSKWIEAFALPNQTSETVAQKLVEEVVCRFGAPRQLHSDQGTNFEANLFKDMCLLLGIEKTRTTGLHPQSDGLVERFNRTLLTMLTMYAEEDQQNWDGYLPYVMMAYRASKHESTGQTPNQLMLGREVVLPLTAVIATPAEEDGEIRNYDDAIARMHERLQKSHEHARKHLQKACVHQKTQYDLRAGKATYEVGQPVWLFDPTRKKGVSPKLTSKWKGPFTVVQCVDDLLCRIQLGPRTKAKIVHINRLDKYEGDNAPTWFQQ